MPSTTVLTRIRQRFWTQRNLTVSVAIFLALCVTYGFGVVFDPDGSFLLLLTIGVVVPTLYDEYWPPYDRMWKAVCWIVVASAVASGAFSSLYWIGTELFGLSPLLASTGAFLLTMGGGIVLLAR
ncbi:hypothetical protein [Salinigranum salinum]|uniref:hypothetical protein n=1 Tax=Salinigranum salinum TaxID=1364937 RepID=UPI0012611816|nr:hypothetical protein [Salinigranum salinum]